MNKILTMLAAAAGVIAFSACDNYDDRYTAEYASVVRLETSGEQQVTMWTSYPQTNYDIKILRSGHDIKQSANAILRHMTAEEWQEYTMSYGMRGYNAVPAKCVIFNNVAGSTEAVVPFEADQIAGTLSLQIITAEVRSFIQSIANTDAAANGIVVPLVLTTDNGSVYEESKYLVLNLDVQTPKLMLSPAGFEKVNCSATASPYVKQVTVSLTPDDNRDGFTVKLANSQSLIDSYNAANGTAYELVKSGLEYSLDGESWNDWSDLTLDFPAGTTAKTISVRMVPSKLSPMDAMALELTDATITAETKPEMSASVFAVVVKPASVKITAADATANNDDGSHPVGNLFDGRITSYYRSANTEHDGDPVYGSYVDIKLPSAKSYFAFDVTTLASGYNAAANPNVVHLYGSTDGVNWKKFGEITDMQSQFTGAAKTASFGNFKTDEPVTYVRWAVIMAGATGEADLCEAKTSAYWAATHLRVFGK